MPRRLSFFPRYQSRPKWRILFFSFPSLRFSFDASSTIFSLSLRRLSFSHCFCPSRAQCWHRSRPLRRAWHRSRTLRRELSRRCLRPRGHFSRSPRSSPTNPRARLEATAATSAGRPLPLPSSTICQGILITNKSWLLPLLLLDVLDSRNFIVSLVYTLYATDIVGSKQFVPSRIRSVMLGAAL